MLCKNVLATAVHAIWRKMHILYVLLPDLETPLKSGFYGCLSLLETDEKMFICYVSIAVFYVHWTFFVYTRKEIWTLWIKNLWNYNF